MPKADTEVIVEKPLLSGFQVRTVEQSFLRRLAIVITGCLGSCGCSGLVFGFSALNHALVTHGAFSDKCSGDENAHGVACDDQTKALNTMFVASISMLNIASLPTGILIDLLGPRYSGAFFSLFLAASCAIFANGTEGRVGHLAYFGGFAMMALAGPGVFLSCCSFANLFPKKAGVVMAALVGCFDASSAVFAIFAAVVGYGFSLPNVFLSYTIFPILIAVTSLALWPKTPCQVAPDAPEDEVSEPGFHVGRKQLGLFQQFVRSEFWLFAYGFSVMMTSVNFFIGTVLVQMTRVNSETAEALTQVFSVMLPVGGIAYIPVIGTLVDKRGPIVSFLILCMCMVIFQILLGFYSATESKIFAFGAFFFVSFSRPLLYTLGAVCTGYLFGYSDFAKVYGAVVSIAGVVNVIGKPLSVLGLARGYSWPNVVLTVLQLSAMAFPIMVMRKERKNGPAGAARRASPRFSPMSPLAYPSSSPINI
eukprot:TRINITY_DN26058_c0_g1_i1.p1 TRINITY_DN26058_c0_g1~~TRINITY_DN26058_c0_g1_i1.p1  ORF type:complete len:478 (+),score=45.57 TRINITY_DN26058_c0_g1_i1:93-1526(+)